MVLTIIKQRVIRGLTRKLIRCQQAVPWISQSLDRELPLRQRVLLRLHLFTCQLCVRYGLQLQFLRDALRHYSTKIETGQVDWPVVLSSDSRERIKLALRRQGY
jgi:hypothetical protein